MTIIYLVIVFHFPVWKFGYKNYKYRFFDNMPRWMQEALSIRNNYERKYELLDVFYWFRLGRFYIRKYHSNPANTFKQSHKHLFCWRVY
jgi:hypothetical protein